MRYSFIVPVFNRPDEVDELLESLTKQTLQDFEVVIVEDGSTNTCKDVCNKYADILTLSYFFKENSGPGQSRNYGVERAKGDYVVIVDSDAVLPDGYLKAIDDELRREPCDAFGGPDASHPSFTPIQKAISYSMTSFFTTGGIRGGKKQMEKFHPRSFNMGVRREVYLALGGFSPMRFSKMSLYGEDIDFSIRIFKGGYSCRLFPEAWVWHKRRTDFGKFWRQVYNSGLARINLYKKYPEALKLVHALPAVFTVGTCLLLILAIVAAICCGWKTAALVLSPLLLYVLLILIDSSIRNRSLYVGLLSVPSSFIQLIGYGVGFLEAWWQRCVLKK